jgi:site-specific DNA-methyltransferase (adenine-specific)
VFDPFCGCGTAAAVAERLERRWVGIDIARKAIDVIEQRLARVGFDPPPVICHPADVESAEALAERDPAQFERWALRRLAAEKLRRTDRAASTARPSSARAERRCARSCP